MKPTKYRFTCEFSFEINLKNGEKLEHGIKDVIQTMKTNVEYCIQDHFVVDTIGEDGIESCVDAKAGVIKVKQILDKRK